MICLHSLVVERQSSKLEVKSSILFEGKMLFCIWFCYAIKSIIVLVDET